MDGSISSSPMNKKQQTQSSTFVSSAPVSASTNRSTFLTCTNDPQRRPRVSTFTAMPTHRINNIRKAHIPSTYAFLITSTLTPLSTSTPTIRDGQTIPDSFDHKSRVEGRPEPEQDKQGASKRSVRDSVSPFEESLALLEWESITKRALRYSETNLGLRYLLDENNPRHLYIPKTYEESMKLLELTREAYYLHEDFKIELNLNPATDVTSVVNMTLKDFILSTKDLLAIGQTLNKARTLKRDVMQMISDPDTKFHRFRELLSELNINKSVENEIFKSIDIDTGEINDMAYPELKKVRDSMRSITFDIKMKLNEMMSKNSESIQDRLITSRYDRYVIPVKASYKSNFKNGIIHDSSSTGNTFFIEPRQIMPLNDNLKSLKSKEKTIIMKILISLTNELIQPNAVDIAAVCDTLSIIHATFIRLKLSLSYSGVDVELQNLNQRDLYLPKLRHPMLMWNAVDEQRKLELQMRKGSKQKKKKQQHEQNSQDDDDGGTDETEEKLPAWEHSVIPATYKLNNEVRCVCVTGPNTGGKTLTLKTLGVAALLAKAGFFIPACPSPIISLNENKDDEDLFSNWELKVKMPYFDQVLADIGDDQSLVQSLSTFSGHVRRIKRIISSSTKESLVLLDEIGSGTDPAEGAALGMSVLKHLAIGKRARLIFATTHHGELKTLKYANDNSARLFENASVEFDDVAMKPTYRLIWGIPGRSNALSIAERLGLDTTVIESARDLLSGSTTTDEKKVNLERMIESLEEDKKESEQLREESERSWKEVNKMREDISKRLEGLKSREMGLRKEQKEALNKEIEKGKQEIAKVIKEMQRNGGSSQNASKAREQLKVIENKTKGLKIDTNSGACNMKLSSTNDVKVGDKVVVKNISSGGEVEIVEVVSKREMMVAFGTMRMKVKINDVVGLRRKTEILEMNQQQESMGTSSGKSTSTGTSTIVRTSANCIDVRGERVDSACSKIETAMDRSLTMGALWIIHGHGTGKLKAGVRNLLQSHNLVERFEDAQQSDGGSGVTIVYF